MIAVLATLFAVVLLRLHGRLRAAEGERDTAVLRIALFWAAALLLTIWLPAEELGGWRTYLGVFFAAVALLGTWNAVVRERDALRQRASASSSSAPQ